MTPSPNLPKPLTDYFDRTDATNLLPLFAPDAIVKDEGEIHEGETAIAAWLESVEARYRPRYRVISSDGDNAKTTVTFEVSGTFPGSPAVLRQNFTLAGDRIQRIETL